MIALYLLACFILFLLILLIVKKQDGFVSLGSFTVALLVAFVPGLNVFFAAFVASELFSIVERAEFWDKKLF